MLACMHFTTKEHSMKDYLLHTQHIEEYISGETKKKGKKKQH